ncbi:MAG: sigma 54-interacting transcriptional regulator [Proteobacteria bacterium]|nr:sigma 54-interacting transcriptional regulator [Pseudomonadota bacterium]
MDISNKKKQPKSVELRHQAEEQLHAKKAHMQLSMANEESQRLIHELEVHQIELEMQNTELRRAQEELELSKNIYTELYDFAPVGYFTLNTQRLIKKINLTGTQMLGIERQQLINKPFVSFIADTKGIVVFSKYCEKVFQNQSNQTCEISLKRKNDTVFYAQLQSIAKENIDKSNYIYTAIIDITKLKKVQEKLRTSEARYRSYIEVTGELAWNTNPDGDVVEDLPTWRKFTGQSEEETKRAGWANALHPDDIKHTIESWKKAVTTKSTYEVEYRIRRYDGVYRLFLVRGVPVIKQDGSILEWVGICIDINERNKMKDALQKAHDELEHTVDERTAELKSALSEIKAMKDQLEAENIYFRQESKMKHRFEHIIGQSDGLKYVLYRAEQVAPLNTTVLILGETGTGKELIAAAIHEMSPRKERPLITVNCAALPANLIESELFGREKGAFTGADTRQIGRFEIANGSTLCLDEIGELPLELQAKLLRVIQHNEFERLGSSKTIKVDVRIVATTNRDLEKEVSKGLFRQDLYYRLNVFPISVPPLRQRKDDIPLMVKAFIERYSRKLGKKITSIQDNTMKAIQDYSWPGNIRELESIIERSVVLSPEPVFYLADRLQNLPPPLLSGVRSLEETDRNQILKILSETRWRINGKNGAAEILGLHPSTLRARMHKLGIVRPGLKEPES